MRFKGPIAAFAIFALSLSPALSPAHAALDRASLPPSPVVEESAPCVNTQEAEAILLMFAASMFRSLGKSCKGQLAAGSPLAEPDSPFIVAFERAGDEQFDTAMSGLGKITGTPLPPGLDKNTIRQLFTAFMPGDIVKGVTPEKCGAIDRIATVLASLPPSSTAGLIIAIVTLSQDDKPKGGSGGKDVPICSARGTSQ